MNRTRIVQIALIASILLLTACASLTGKRRLATGMMYGATAGAIGGALLSPNDESRGLNALVFGLSGALVGGVTAFLTESDPVSTASSSLKDRELGSPSSLREFPISPSQELPDFLKKRVQPVVIEEFVESDRVTDEGTLHEPHKAYRIKRPAELFARPIEAAPTPGASKSGARR